MPQPLAPLTPQWLPGTGRNRVAEPDTAVLHHIDHTPLPAVPFVALVPGADAVIVTLDLPPGLRGAARDAVAQRQVADRLGRDPATLDLRPARFSGHKSWQALLVADRAKVADWRARVAPAGRLCRAILPDWMAVPACDGVWTVVTGAGPTGSGMVQVRMGVSEGFSAEPDLAALALTLALGRDRGQNAGPAPSPVSGPAQGPQSGGLPQLVLRLGPPDAAVDTALAGLPVVSDPADLPTGLGPALVLGHDEMVLDLATDPRAAVLALRARLAALRVPLALAALALVFWFAGTVIETNRARAEDAALRAAITAEVRRDFLPTGPIVDIPTQVARELDRRRRLADQSPDTPAPLRLLYRASVILAASEAKVLAVSHREGGELTLDLTAADFATLDRIAGELRAQGLTVRTGQSSAEAPGRVNGTLLVEAER